MRFETLSSVPQVSHGYLEFRNLGAIHRLVKANATTAVTLAAAPGFDGLIDEHVHECRHQTIRVSVHVRVKSKLNQLLPLFHKKQRVADEELRQERRHAAE